MSESFHYQARKSKSNTPLLENGFFSQKTTPDAAEILHSSQMGDQNVTPHLKQADASYRNDDKISPMLAKLRMTPGRLLKEKQTRLVKLHEESRKKVDSLNIGGGVSLWPEMEKMRMTLDDVYHLCGFCVVLVFAVIAVFWYLHGSTLTNLLQYTTKLRQFSRQHKITIETDQAELDKSLIRWHTKYKEIVDSIHEEFDVSKLPATYLLYIFIYLGTLAVLFYYLIDNMFAKSKLSPRRIRRWVSLLTLTGTWTCSLVLSLVIAVHTENAIESNIHYLSDTLADVIPTSLSCEKFIAILQYWRIRCLPPTTHGTISIFGIIPVRDVTFYLQYYCIPIVTVLIAPVFRLVVSLMTLYNVKHDKVL